MSRDLGTRSPASEPVGVDDLQAGMILAEDVFDQQGRMLMPVGTELTDRHLRACQLWGIMSIRIRSEGAGAEVSARVPTPEQYAVAEATTRHRFQLNDLTHPLAAELFQICLERAADRACDDGGRDG